MRKLSPLSLFAVSTALLASWVGCGGKAIIDGQPGTSNGGSASTTTNTVATTVTTTVTTSTGTGGMAAAECNIDADCVISNSCCGCFGVAIGGVDPDDECEIDCDQPACDMHSDAPTPRCVRGQCTAGFTCVPVLDNPSCNAPRPECPGAGMVPSIENSCWGPCVFATECTAVENCGNCGNDSCLVSSDNPGQALVTHCFNLPDACDAANCACMSSALCVSPEDCFDGFEEGDVACVAPGL